MVRPRQSASSFFEATHPRNRRTAVVFGFRRGGPALLQIRPPEHADPQFHTALITYVTVPMDWKTYLIRDILR